MRTKGNHVLHPTYITLITVCLQSMERINLMMRKEELCKCYYSHILQECIISVGFHNLAEMNFQSIYLIMWCI